MERMSRDTGYGESKRALAANISCVLLFRGVSLVRARDRSARGEGLARSARGNGPDRGIALDPRSLAWDQEPRWITVSGTGRRASDPRCDRRRSRRANGSNERRS